MSYLLRPDHSDLFTVKNCIDKLHDDTSDFCDGAIASNDGDIIRVHKFVMAVKSEHLKTLFFGESRLRFGTANDDAPIKLDFPGKVLRSIKAYCYKDSCDDGFSKLLSDVRGDEAVGVLNERLTNDDIAARGRFLVMLTAAADYLLIPGLPQMLYKEAYTYMRFHVPKSIPVIYGEALNCG